MIGYLFVILFAVSFISFLIFRTGKGIRVVLVCMCFGFISLSITIAAPNFLNYKIINTIAIIGIIGLTLGSVSFPFVVMYVFIIGLFELSKYLFYSQKSEKARDYKRLPKKECPVCGSMNILQGAYIEDGSVGDWCPHCRKSLQKMRGEMRKECPVCGSSDIVHGAYIEDGGSGDRCPHCKKSPREIRDEINNDLRGIEGETK